MFRRFAFLLWTFLIFIPFAFASEPLPKRSYEIGPEIYRFVYEEKSVLVKDQGMMYGLKGSMTHHHNRYMFRLEGRGALGDVDYSSGGTGSIDNIKDYVFEGRLLAGYDYIDEDTKLYTVYTGLGYRYLNDAGGGTVSTTGAHGYDREANYFYWPLGIEANAIMNENWNVGAYAEYDYLLSGTQESHLSTAFPAYNDVFNDQNTGWGFRGGIKFQKYTEKMDFTIEPFVRLWRIENSEVSTVTVAGLVAGSGIEPQNKTTEWGANLSLAF